MYVNVLCFVVFLTPDLPKDCSPCLLAFSSTPLSWKVYKDTFFSQCTHKTSVHILDISDSEHVVCLPPCGNNEKPHSNSPEQQDKNHRYAFARVLMIKP